MKKSRSCEDLMSTSLVTLRESDTLSQAIREMTLGSFRHMPVVDADERVIGIVSSHDVVASLEKHADKPLGEIMNRHIVTVRPDTPASVAVGLMIDQKLNCVPVVSDEQRLVGLLTATDFLVVAHQALTGGRIERAPHEI